MSKSRMIITLGVLVALLPILGFPRAWEGAFQVFAGLAIVGISLWSKIDRKLALKAKAQMRQRRTVTEVPTPAEQGREADSSVGSTEVL